MKCACGGIIEAGSCSDCGSVGLMPVGLIIRQLRAHRRAGNMEVIRAVQEEIGEPPEVIVERRIPIETILSDPLLKDYTMPVNGFKQGRPQKVTAQMLIRIRAMMLNGCSTIEVAKALDISERTLLEYVSRCGTFKETAMKRLRGEKRCVPIRCREKRKEAHEANENCQ